MLVEEVDRGTVKALCVSGRVTTLKGFVSPAVVDVPADAMVPAVPSPHWWMQKERDVQPKVMMLAIKGKTQGFKTKNPNSRFPLTAKSFREACSRQGHSLRKSRRSWQIRWMLRYRKRKMAVRLVFALVRPRGRHGYMRCVRHRLAGRLVGHRAMKRV